MFPSDESVSGKQKKAIWEKESLQYGEETAGQKPKRTKNREAESVLDHTSYSKSDPLSDECENCYVKDSIIQQYIEQHNEEVLSLNKRRGFAENYQNRTWMV